MLIDSNYPCAATPYSFASLMELYEENYIRLRRLIPNMDAVQGPRISHVTGCLDLHLEPIARHRYTSDFLLTYRFESNEPNLCIRIYFDARAAEALRGVRRENETIVGNDLASRWRLNRFLYKWLGFCLLRGHLFCHSHPVSTST